MIKLRGVVLYREVDGDDVQEEIDLMKMIEEFRRNGWQVGRKWIEIAPMMTVERWLEHREKTRTK